MSNLNKLFLALAFLGGSAAVQAASGGFDPARVEWGKAGERSDEAKGWARSLGEPTMAGSTSSGWMPTVYERLSATYNGLPVKREDLLGRYDVKRIVPTSAALLTPVQSLS